MAYTYEQMREHIEAMEDRERVAMEHQRTAAERMASERPVAERMSGATVPTLHQLCCDLIVTAVINLDNAPSILDFAQRHNVVVLRQRAERFCEASWRGLSERHDAAVLREALGVEAYLALAKDHAELEQRKEMLKRMGSVITAPAAAPPATAPTAAARPAAAPLAAATPAAAAAVATTALQAARAKPPESEAAARARRRFSGGGGGETCVLCAKRVYPAERVGGVGQAYHVDCFRCTTCKCKLTTSSYERAEDGTLLCKTHLKQHVHATRRSSLCTESAPSVGPVRWLGDAGERCVRCNKPVYAAEMQLASAHHGGSWNGQGDDQVYHKACFRCADCGRGPLRPGDWVVEAQSGTLLCCAHHTARRQQRGSFGSAAAEEGS